jgi:hypothetical protein
MAFSLPSTTRTMDDTWSRLFAQISTDVADNVTEGTPVSTLLLAKKKPRMGGDRASENLRTQHAPSGNTLVAIGAGSDLPTGDFKSRTTAEWYMKYQATPITRNVLLDDVQERGKDLIIKTFTDKLQVLKDTMIEQIEAKIFDTIDTTEASLEIQGLNTMIPILASRATGTYGGITRPTYSVSTANTISRPDGGNTFHGGVYLAEALGDADFGLKDHLTTMLNGITNTREGYKSDLIIMPQNYFELYEAFGESKAPVVRGAGRLLDLGFESLTFKGIPIVWSSKITANNILFLNTNAITVEYDPMWWFTMGEWAASSPRSLDRVADIYTSLMIYSKYLSKMGRLYYA